MSDIGLNSNKTEYSAVEIYTKYSGLIRRVICSRVKDANRADDIFQDLFLHLVANPIRFDVGNIEKYLYRIVVNCVSDNARKSASYRVNTYRYAKATDIADRYYTPDSSVIDSDETAKILRLVRLQHLEKQERRAVTLHYRNGREIHEIAGVMGVKKESASRYVSSGLIKIRGALASKWGNNI